MYVLALLAGLPARRVIGDGAPALHAISGSIWRGGATLGTAMQLDWRWAPLRSLATLRPAFDWTVAGPDTVLAGGASWRPAGLALDHVTGSADGALVATLAPALPFDCALALQIDLDRIILVEDAYAVSGEVTGAPGSCRARGGAASDVPALRAHWTQDDGASRLLVAPLRQPGRTLVLGQLGRDGALSLTVTPTGAAVLPFVAGGRATTIDTQL